MNQPRGEGGLAGLARSQRGLLWHLVAISGVVNVLTLGLSLFTMQIYDRVLTSQSRDTLLFLTIAVAVAIALASVLSVVRQQAATRAGAWLGVVCGPGLLHRSIEQRLAMPTMQGEALRELNAVRSFAASPTLFNLLDTVWVPLYLVVVFLIDATLGLISLAGVAALFGLALLNERATRTLIGASTAVAADNLRNAETLLLNCEAVEAMGMTHDVVRRWSAGVDVEAELSGRSQSVSNLILGVSKFVRYAIQIALFAVGALLVLDQSITAGALIAVSILSARLLAPVEGAMGFWRQFVVARNGWAKLVEFTALPPLRTAAVDLPRPAGRLAAVELSYVAPGRKSPVLRNVAFAIEPGQVLGVAGPSGSGKSTLARVVMGAVKPSAGHVRLDGADTFEWRRPGFGRHVGYLPQEVELLPGTIRDNIARFRDDASDEAVVAAAVKADCHQLILDLPQGYDTVLTDGGRQLSGGQRQRIGLARALYGDPALIVLDEPNAALDAAGGAALNRVLDRLREARVTTVLVSHRLSLLARADRVLVLRDGRVAASGPPAEVLGRAEQPAPVAARPDRSPEAQAV